MDRGQFGIMTTFLQQILDVQMMLLKNADPDAAATVNHVHNELNMFMYQDWEPVSRARELVEEMQDDT